MRLATVASRVMCLRRWKPDKEKDGGDGEEVGGYGGGGTCHNDKRALKVGMTDGWV